MYYNSFNDCVSLESFIVDKDNNYFSSVDGVLYNKDKTTLIRCPQTKKSISVIDSVTKIDEGACYGCESLENILLPDKLTEIGKDAFNNCQSLEEIHIPESVTEVGHRAFFGTAWLDNYPDDLVIVGDGVLYKCRDDAEGEITIPKTVKKIVDEAFYRCTALESITIPDSVTKIGFGAFSGCSALKSLIIPDSVTTLDYELTEDGILTDCTSLVSVTIGNSVTTIPPCTFGNCTSLKNVTLGNSVGEIKEIAFYDCTSLESITLPNSVTSIGTSSFEDCTSLKSVYIPDSVTLIEEEAFYGCTSLANVIGGAGVSTIYGNSFAGTPVYENPSGDFIIAGDILVEYRGSEENVTIPEGVKSIPMYFKKDSPNSYSGGGSGLTVNDDLKLRSVILPESLKTIGKYAFAYCYSLGDITIPDSVTLIEEDAFSGFRSRIFCTEGSCAEEYAKNNSINYELIAGEFRYNINGEGSARIVAYTGGEQKITIPDVINGRTVAGLSLDSFDENCPERIIVPASVTSITGGFNWTDIWEENRRVSTLATLSEIVVDENNEAYTTVDGILYDKAVTKLIYCPRGKKSDSVAIPDTVTEIGDQAFYCCSMIGNVTVPDSVTKLGWAVFSGCTSLETVRLSEKLEVIPDNSFSQCSSLVSVNIPASVKTIEAWAFDGCYSLNRIDIPKEVTDLPTYSYDGGETWEQMVFPVDDDFVLGCYSNSHGEQYAKDHNINYVLLDDGSDPDTDSDTSADIKTDTPDTPDDKPKAVCGDLDDDGLITANDALAILRSSIGMETFSPEQDKLADIDGDGSVTANDALAVLRYSVGIDDGIVGKEIMI